MGGGGGGNLEHTFVHLTQHVPVSSLPKYGPAKLVFKRSTGCLRGMVKDDSYGIVLQPFNAVGKSLTAGGVPHSGAIVKVIKPYTNRPLPLG